MSSLTSPSAAAATESDGHLIRQLPENWLRTDIILALVVAFVSVLSLQALRLTDVYEQTGVSMFTAQALSLVISSLLVFYRRFPVTTGFVYTAIIVLGSLAA